ncbi:helix-turn-helix domain-containing protein [bacterium]|nr:helix-turn-helix domain-containing protein [bacterium]
MIKNDYLTLINGKIKEYNLTLAQISEFTDIEQGKLKLILSGKSRLKMPVLLGLCYLLQIDLKEILNNIKNEG